MNENILARKTDLSASISAKIKDLGHPSVKPSLKPKKMGENKEKQLTNARLCAIL